MPRRRMLSLALLVLGIASGDVARAAELFTSTLLSPTASYRLLCIATNVGTREKPMSISLIDSDTGSDVATQDCPAVAPGTTCYVASPYGSLNGHCRFSAKTRMRAAIWLQELAGDGKITAALPATSK